MGHYGCNDLLSILSSGYSAFFTVYHSDPATFYNFFRAMTRLRGFILLIKSVAFLFSRFCRRRRRHVVA